MKRAIAIFACLCVLAGGEYFAISKWAIRHQTLNLFDATRQRPVSVDLAVRRDYEVKADNGFWKLPLAIIIVHLKFCFTQIYLSVGVVNKFDPNG